MRVSWTAFSRSRSYRQIMALDWVRRAFPGFDGRKNRVERILEEAMELAQVEGYPVEKIGELAAKVYSREVGEARQEVGGIGLALLAYCQVAGICAESAEKVELERVWKKPIEHFHARLAEKVEAGICSTDLAA